MGYRLLDIELTDAIQDTTLGDDQTGFGIVVRWKGNLLAFEMIPSAPAATISGEELSAFLIERLAERLLVARVEEELVWKTSAPPVSLPSLTVAICTHHRASRLGRLLLSLDRHTGRAAFAAFEVVVIDNAPTDDSTRDIVMHFPGVRYFVEPRPGLNFARNAAVQQSTGEIIAFLDDDVVLDRNYFAGLADACRHCPGAGGYTGLVLPFRLDTDAQILFERRGGFGRGFSRREFRSSSFSNRLHPVGAGAVGAGCNMAFDRGLLISLGYFDEALDTGSPLPGGGDLDIFYRVLRSGRAIAYEPQYAVYHEHRHTLRQLRRQYWSWGLGMMAFLVKSRRIDSDLRSRHNAMVRWWFVDQMKAAFRSAWQFDRSQFSFALAELWGGIQGLLGEYDRSQARVREIRNANDERQA